LDAATGDADDGEALDGEELVDGVLRGFGHGELS
jgi:hypothetical protein